jgi:putative hydroxymethylpyrimidine transport system permease protein
VKPAFRILIVIAGLLAFWQAAIVVLAPAPFLLPAPDRVAATAAANAALLLQHGAITVLEILLGIVLGVLFGASCAFTMTALPGLRRWLLPLIVASQAVPVFAIAPLLVLWLGYGLASKVIMASLIIFFPVAVALYDGLRRVDPKWIDLARVMTAGHNHANRSIVWRIRLPAALPAAGSGLRVAVAVAPIGAVIGEWVGASAGLGFLMLQANARLQTELMFAAMIVLAAVAVALYAACGAALRALLPWSPEFARPSVSRTEE